MIEPKSSHCIHQAAKMKSHPRPLSPGLTPMFLHHRQYHCTPTMQVQMFLCRCQRNHQRKRKHRQSRN
jgi:hypothetical protein